MTVFLRTRMDVDVLHANYYMGALFLSLMLLLVDGFPEMSLTIQRLEVFYKQKELRFYPAWAYAIPAALLKVPYSLVASVVWTSLTYYVIGYSSEVQRLVHLRTPILIYAYPFPSFSHGLVVKYIYKTCIKQKSAWLHVGAPPLIQNMLECCSFFSFNYIPFSSHDLP